jgi:hypothetical protein
MTKQEHWLALVAGNPGMKAGKPMTFAGYKKLHDAAWDAAVRELTRPSAEEIPEFLQGLFAARRPPR